MKPFKVDITKSAILDYFEAADYYFSISVDLGQKFERHFEEEKQILETSYQSFGFAGVRKLRRLIIAGFPFKIVYLVNYSTETVVILAIIHTARSKNYLRKKLK